MIEGYKLVLDLMLASQTSKVRLLHDIEVTRVLNVEFALNKSIS